MTAAIANPSKWRRERRQNAAHPTPKRQLRDNGCICHTGPRMVATFRGPSSTLSVALEHWNYCPEPNTAMDPEAYWRTGQKVPLRT